MKEAKKIIPEWIPNAYSDDENKARVTPLATAALIVKEYSLYPTKKTTKNKKSRR